MTLLTIKIKYTVGMLIQVLVSCEETADTCHTTAHKCNIKYIHYSTL